MKKTAEEEVSWTKEKAKEAFEAARLKAEAAKDAIASNLKSTKSNKIKDEEL